MEPHITSIQALRQILTRKGLGTQEELRSELEKLGHEVNQSTISRHLRKLGAIKILNSNSEPSYKLPEDEAPPSLRSSLSELVQDIVCNEYLIVIHTNPGSASLIARSLDHYGSDKILGTIAGDDTIFVTLPSHHSTKKMVEELKSYFDVKETFSLR